MNFPWVNGIGQKRACLQNFRSVFCPRPLLDRIQILSGWGDPNNKRQQGDPNTTAGRGWAGSLTLGKGAVQGPSWDAWNSHTCSHVRALFECLPYSADDQGTPWPVRQETLALSIFPLSTPANEDQWLEGWWKGAGGKQLVSKTTFWYCSPTEAKEVRQV